MKVLTITSTIFLPLTVLTGMWGTNVPLHAFPGGGGTPVPVGCGQHAGDVRRHAGAVSAQGVALTWREFTCFQATSPTKLPPVRSSSARRRSSRSSSRTRSMRAARRISIAIELGGKKLIHVEDDGEGMEPEDARRAVERHATSKIRRAEDLEGIATLGFRGEALAAVASVAHFVLRSRARGTESGTEIRVNGGAVVSVTEVGMAEGTSIDVADLFYNLPARRKFLKSDGAESAQVSRVVTQLGLCYPEIGFSLTSARRKVLQCPPTATLRDRLYQLYGERSDLIEARREAGGRQGRRIYRRAGRAGTHARSAERVRESADREGPHHRPRHHRRLQRGLHQGAQP